MDYDINARCEDCGQLGAYPQSKDSCFGGTICKPCAVKATESALKVLECEGLAVKNADGTYTGNPEGSRRRDQYASN